MMKDSMDTTTIVEYAHELKALVAEGLTYLTKKFDVERYERIRTIASKLISSISDADYQTPKISTRAAFFNEKEEILLVKDFDGKWFLPDEWCEYNQTIVIFSRGECIRSL